MTDNPIIATLAGLTLGSANPDQQGVIWRIGSPDGLKGWWDSPEVSIAMVNKPASHGGYTAPWYFQQRIIEISGTVTAPDITTRFQAQYALAAICTNGAPATLIIDEPTGPKQCAVTLGGPTKITDIDATSFRYSLMLVAADMRKYDTALQSLSLTPSGGSSGGISLPLTVPYSINTAAADTSSATVVNVGTFPTIPTIEVSGGCVNPRIYNLRTGQFIAAEISLDPGQSLTFDFAATQTYFQSTIRDVLASGSEWWQLLQGENSLAVSAYSSDPGCAFNITYRGCWV